VGTFSVELEVGNAAREQFVRVEAVVDTGAIYTMLPEDLLDSLGVQRLESDIFELADDSLVEYAIGSATLRLQGRTLPAPVVFARPENTPLLGATTLEIFRLVADPVNEQLMPAPRIRARFI
jgi:clan AA aspartic protease